MSDRESEKLKVVSCVEEGYLRQCDAAGILGLSVRQVRRLQNRCRKEGDVGVVHRLCGKVSNRRISEGTKGKVESLVREKYHDFGPTLASECLKERDEIAVSSETLRGWMISWDLWKSRKRRVKHRQWRERKGCLGEMVQMDTSVHDWFEGREAKAELILMIDDATSRIYARFFRTDSTATNMDLIKGYLRRYGRPKAIYADKASHFKTTRPTTIEEDLAGRDSETQIGRALRELDVRYISAHSPQAKGRVERSFETMQDRLIKMMRLEGISTIQEANEYLRKEFLGAHNRKFAMKAAKPIDLHRPIKGYNLDAILSVHEQRVVANDYTIRFEKRLFQIEKESVTSGLRKGKVLVECRLDGSMKLRFRGCYLKFHEILPERQAIRLADRAVTPVALRAPSVTAHNIQQSSP